MKLSAPSRTVSKTSSTKLPTPLISKPSAQTLTQATDTVNQKFTALNTRLLPAGFFLSGILMMLVLLH